MVRLKLNHVSKRGTRLAGFSTDISQFVSGICKMYVKLVTVPWAQLSRLGYSLQTGVERVSVSRLVTVTHTENS